MAKTQDSEKYLKTEQYYIDLYDLFTINRCLDTIRFYQKVCKEHINDGGIKDLPEEEKQNPRSRSAKLRAIRIATSH